LIVYFDSSALVKLVLDEDGSDVARDLWKLAAKRVSSHVVYPEVRSALAAARRSGRIDVRQLTVAVESIDSASRALNLLDVDSEVAERAGEMAELHALRGYDAIHLASMVSFKVPRLVVGVWDQPLAVAASRCGLGVVPAPRSWSDERTGDQAGPLESV
jgi:uncharacterized protein